MAAGTRYAKCGELHLAYQVHGRGQLDLVFMPQWATHVELLWEDPATSRFLGRLASFSRLILFDRRGVGLSDPVSDADIDSVNAPDDLLSVLDTVQSERPAVMACDGAGFGAIRFAVQNPERMQALVLANTTARIPADQGYTFGVPSHETEVHLETLAETWAEGPAFVSEMEPSMVGNDAYSEWLSRYQRAAARPSTIVAIDRGGIAADVRALLPKIQVPTLVLHRADDAYFPVEHGRYLAEKIPGATYVELPGNDHTVTTGDQQQVLDEVELFLVGRRTTGHDRILAAVLFIDIVESTQRAVAIGDRAWRDLLDSHDRAVRSRIAQHRGREIFTKGDEFLAVFETPTEAIRCAETIRTDGTSRSLHIRAGLHAGELEVRGDDIVGVAVHIASRIQALAEPDQILVSGTIAELLRGSDRQLADRGTHTLRGVPGEWQLWEATEPHRP